VALHATLEEQAAAELQRRRQRAISSLTSARGCGLHTHRALQLLASAGCGGRAMQHAARSWAEGSEELRGKLHDCCVAMAHRGRWSRLGPKLARLLGLGRPAAAGGGHAPGGDAAAAGNPEGCDLETLRLCAAEVTASRVRLAVRELGQATDGDSDAMRRPLETLAVVDIGGEAMEVGGGRASLRCAVPA
jgi:hypothetical protein